MLRLGAGILKGDAIRFRFRNAFGKARFADNPTRLRRV